MFTHDEILALEKMNVLTFTLKYKDSLY